MNYKPGDRLLGGSVTIGPDGEPGPQICPECGYEDEDGFGSNQSMSSDDCPVCGWGPRDSEGCETCGACAGEECDCGDAAEDPRDFNDARRDAKRVGEGLSFDRFMDRILITEGKQRITSTDRTPQQVRAARNQDRPLNKIRFTNGGK